MWRGARSRVLLGAESLPTTACVYCHVWTHAQCVRACVCAASRPLPRAAHERCPDRQPRPLLHALGDLWRLISEEVPLLCHGDLHAQPLHFSRKIEWLWGVQGTRGIVFKLLEGHHDASCCAGCWWAQLRAVAIAPRYAVGLPAVPGDYGQPRCRSGSWTKRQSTAWPAGSAAGARCTNMHTPEA